MIKKFLCVVLVCSIVATSTQRIDAALHQKDDNYQQAETKSNYTIEELYKLRNSLSADFENFSDAIARIDKQLESLGVEEISQSEVEEKLGLTEHAIQPFISVSSTSDIKWTSTREYYVYRGKSYELQIIRGVPAKGSGQLWSNNLQYKGATSSGFNAASKNVAKVVVNKIAGCLPQVGGMISNGLTFYNAFKGVISGLSPTTSVGAIECAYTSSISSSYLYVFIKYSGDVDTGNQILGYCGNVVTYETSISTPGSIKINGTWLPKIYTTYVSGTITSPYYNEYRNVASNVFWEYKNGNPNVPYRYDIYNFWVQALDTTIRLEAPYAFPY